MKTIEHCKIFRGVDKGHAGEEERGWCERISDRLGITHAGVIEKVGDVAALGEEKVGGGRNHLNTEEE